MKKNYYSISENRSRKLNGKTVIKIFGILAVLLSLAVIFSACGKEEVKKTQSQKVESAVEKEISNESFEILPKEEKADKAKEIIDKMVDEGNIKEDSVVFDEENGVYSFEYSDGTLGGIFIDEFNDETNKGGSDSEVNEEDDDSMYNVREEDLTAIVLHAFGDSAFRRDFYVDLEDDWDLQGLQTSVDTDVTVDDFKRLENFDVVVFAMHGSLYSEHVPALCLEQISSSKTDELLKDDLSSGAVAKIIYGDGKSRYWILPDFFTNNYSENSMASKIIFSESCEFYGDDEDSAEVNLLMSDALNFVSDGATIGYHNSVLAEYSRNVMKMTVDEALNGSNAAAALEEAKEEYGEYDGLSAYPVITGNVSATLVEIPVSDFTVPDKMNLTIGEIDVIEPGITPENASGYSIKWTSSDENIVSVSPTGENGILTARSKGTATVTAELTSKENVITRQTVVRVAPKGRDTVLVLDVSGSMRGEPLEEMKEAAKNFCNKLIDDEYNNRVGIVFYEEDVRTIDLTDNLNSLISYIDGVEDGATTNMEGGVSAAIRMLDSQGRNDSVKNIVIMADGIPNVGNTSDSGSMGAFEEYDESYYASAVIDTARAGMKKYNFYSLGFFHSLDGEGLDFGTTLMKKLTNQDDGYHEVVDAQKLDYAFGDIEETISDGTKIVINIACPVDVRIVHGEEVLCSEEDNYSDSASFGSLQLLGKKKDIKVVTLDPENEYDIELIGTGIGTMDYSIGYVDDKDTLYDYRSFESVPITPSTVITSATENSQDIELKVDNDGDGKIDETWSAAVNGTGKSDKPQQQIRPNTKKEEPEKEGKEEKSTGLSAGMLALIIILSAVGVTGLILAIVLPITLSKKKKANNIPPFTPQRQAVNTPQGYPPAGGQGNFFNDTEPFVPNGYAVVRKPEQGSPSYPAPQPETQPTHRAKVLFAGKDKEIVFPVTKDRPLRVGKDSSWANAIIPVSLAKVSRKHCEISFDEQKQVFVVNDMSKNGVFRPDGKRLNQGVNYVKPGESILIVDKQCKIVLQ